MNRFITPRFLAAMLVLLGSSAVQGVRAGPVEVHLHSLGAGSNLSISYQPIGSSTHQNWSVFAGQYHMHLHGGPGYSGPVGSFNSFCVDLDHAVTVGQSYQANIRSTTDGLASGGQVAYLYKKYGEATILDNAKAAGLQLAMWDLVTDGGDGLGAGRFQFLGGGAIASWALAYLDEAKGKSELGMWLDASASGDGSGRGQSVMLPCHLNPEPTSAVLLGMGLLGMAGYRFRRRKQE